MTDAIPDEHKRDPSAAGNSVESDNIVRWDGERLYVEQDVYENGQLVHRKYRRTVTEPVARALAAFLAKIPQ